LNGLPKRVRWAEALGGSDAGTSSVVGVERGVRSASTAVSMPPRQGRGIGPDSQVLPLFVDEGLGQYRGGPVGRFRTVPPPLGTLSASNCLSRAMSRSVGCRAAFSALARLLTPR